MKDLCYDSKMFFFHSEKMAVHMSRIITHQLRKFINTERIVNKTEGKVIRFINLDGQPYKYF